MDRKSYTEEEILELGRAALKRHKITVFVVHYNHKHGDDISVHGSERSAQEAVRELMLERVKTWDKEDKEKFHAYERMHQEGDALWQMRDGKAVCDTYVRQFDLFHEIEQGVSYGETIEILERQVQ